MTQMDTDKKVEKDPQTFAILGAAMEVHSVLGSGFLEAVYQEALAVEFAERLIPYEREVAIPIKYKWETLYCTYRADFVCYGEIIIEFKAIERITSVEEAQVLNYLKATGFKRALLLNFFPQRLAYKRFVF